MSFSRRQFISLAGIAGAAALADRVSPLLCQQAVNGVLSGVTTPLPDPVAPWKRGVRIRPVSTIPNRHTIHTYFNISPETMDGRYVLYYTSTTKEGYSGDIRIQERATGRETVLARNLNCEDAHRVACQQWVSNDKLVCFQDMRNGDVVVVTVDIKSLKQRVLAHGRMPWWGQQDSDLVPIYGVHFQPGKYVNMQLLNAATGKIRTVVTAKQVREAYPQQIREIYGSRPISLAFGCLSPDLKLIFFKLSTPDETYKPLPEGHLKWPDSYQSNREGLVCFDIEHSKFLFFRRRWGHPSWHPTSKIILDVPNVLIDAYTGKETRIPNLPRFPGQHLDFSPKGKIFVTDTHLEPFGGSKGEWGVAVCDAAGGNWVMIDRFIGDEGAASWRPNHPHPVFSPDGKRIYYNVNSGEWTHLFVAEAAID